ncbi:MAG: hypothetical protein AAFX85_18380, partial [Pseudomonadota bacterium]
MLRLIASLVVLAVSTAAHSALVSQDSLYGPDTITFDTDTGLLWLDWSVTQGLSFDEATGELGAGGLFESFRFATNDEVATLWANAGIVDLTTEGPIDFGTDFTTANFVAAVTLITLLGDTGLNGNLTEATTADAGNLPGTQTVAELQLCTGGPCVAVFGAPLNSALASLGPNDQPAGDSSNLIGAALVRDTIAVVPVPGALVLALS